MNKERVEILTRKVKSVRELGDVISKYQPNVDSLDYEVYYDDATMYYDEFLIINYKGGAKTIKDCTGNSFSAILSEVANYMETGYYEEKERYNKIKSAMKRLEV